MPGYISEFFYAGADTADWIEIVVPAGTDVSSYAVYMYEPEGTVGAGPLSLGTVQDTVAGKDVYVVDVGTSGFGGFDNDEGVALVDDVGTVLQFLSVEGLTITATEGPANGQTSTSVGTASGSDSLQSDDGGSSYFTQSTTNKGTVPCFAAGTLIDTPDGPRPVESLARGDRVLTRDAGAQSVVWARQRVQDFDTARPDARPVLIRAGALGPGRPARDLIVSPQHRVLVGAAGQLRGRFASPALVPAKALTDLPGVRFMGGKRRIVWCHIALSAHAVVTANGAAAETLLLGDMVLGGLSRMQRQAVRELFPAAQPGHALNGAPTHPCLRPSRVRTALAR